MPLKSIDSEVLYHLTALGVQGQPLLRLLDTSLHPLLYFTLEVIIVSLAIGFVPPSPWQRLIFLPLVLFCPYAIISGGSEHLRIFWVGPLAGFAIGLALQYVDLGILRHWGFDDQSSMVLADAKNSQTLPSNQVTTCLKRFRFGLWSTVSFRKVNTRYEVRNTPQYRNRVAPSRPEFLIHHGMKLFICILILDISCQMPPPPNATELFSEQRIRIFSRLGEVSAEELVVRVAGSFVYWCNIYAVLHGLFSFAAVLSVGFGLSKVESWKPLFGSPRDARSLRSFWGKFWHQSLRDNLYEPATFLSDKVLRLPSGILARYTKLFVAFLISGLMHAFAEVGTGLDLQHGGAVRFFCTQATGIILEDAATAVFSNRKRTKGPLLSGLLRSLGYVWVVCFMAWSTPAWFYPDAARGPKVPFLPFSLVTQLRW